MWRDLEYSIIMPLAYFYQSFSLFVQVFEACWESKLFHYSHFLSIYTHVRAYWMVHHTSRKATLQLLSCQMSTNSLNHSSESFLAFYKCVSLSFSLFQQDISLMVPHFQPKNQNLFIMIVTPCARYFGYFLKPFLFLPWRNLHPF